jgi:hypothetical protein
MISNRTSSFLAAAAILILTSTSWAKAQETAQSVRVPVFRYYWFVNLGPFDAQENMGLLRGASWSGSLAGGFGHRLNRFVSGELELGVAGREHAVAPGVLPVEIDDPTLGITWGSYSLVGRLTFGRFEPFAGIGIGSGQADLQVVAQDEPLGSPELEIADDRGLLVLYRVGFDVGVSPRNRIGLELRRMKFEADLGPFTGGSTDIGGTAVLVTYRYLWGERGS